MIFFSLVSRCFCCFLFALLFALEMRTILLLLVSFLSVYDVVHICILCLLPCLTIVKFVMCSFIDVSCTPTGVSEISYLTCGRQQG